MKSKIVCLAITSSLLVACGGGGGAGSGAESEVGSDVQAQSVGVFLDSPVEGIFFETPSLSGLTNARGEFTYIDGERVTFHLGKTILGSAEGASIVTPFSLFNMEAPTRESAISQILKDSDVSSYDRALNVAALLQTLDMDADPDNGIDLGSAHVDLSELRVNLAVKATAFANESSLAEAKAVLGINAQRGLKQVASHLYQSLNLSIKSDLVNQVKESLDARQLITTSLDHDQNGNVVGRNVDTDGDGIDDAITVFSYDAAGNLTGTSNSATNKTEVLSYDENSNLVSRYTHTENARQPDVEERFVFNEDNRLSSVELDHGVDGDAERKVNYHYDDGGKLAAYEIDQDNDGSPESVARYEYEDNKVSAFAEDKDNNGDSDIVIRYTYDSNGNRMSQSVSGSVEGLPSNTSTFEYDENGNVTRYEQDNDQDGRPDYIESSVYDSNNKRTIYRRDVNADRIWDSVTQYTYDVDGNRTSMREDSNGDGTVDKEWFSNYDTQVLDNGWDIIVDKLDAGV